METNNWKKINNLFVWKLTNDNLIKLERKMWQAATKKQTPEKLTTAWKKKHYMHTTYCMPHADFTEIILYKS